jgi:hypothetical protein
LMDASSRSCALRWRQRRISSGNSSKQASMHAAYSEHTPPVRSY